MFLRHKITLITSLVVVTYAVVDHSIQRIFIAPFFQDAWMKEAETLLRDASLAIEDEVRHAGLDAEGWASKGEIKAVAEAAQESRGPKSEEIEDELSRAAQDSDLVLLLDAATPEWVASGGDLAEKRLWSHGWDGLTASEPFREALQDLMTSDERSSGIFNAGVGLMVLSTRPVRRARDEESELLGHIVVGHRLGRETLSQALEGADVEAWPVDGSHLPEGHAGVIESVLEAGHPISIETGDESLRIASVRRAADGTPVLLLLARIEGPTYRLSSYVASQGQRALKYAMISTVASGLIILLVLLLTLQRTILQPIGDLTKAAVTIGKQDDYSKSIELDRDDEIGMLACEFDSMMSKLMQSRSDLVDTARTAGMSEIATSVLHNVGNVLNSVNVSASLLAQRLRESEVVDLARMVELLEKQDGALGAFIDSDPRGKHFFPFLQKLAEQLTHENESASGELRNVTKGIDHIKHLVASQQAYASTAEVLQNTDISIELESIVQMFFDLGDKDGVVDIRREFGETERLLLDRHRLMEILVNLLRNASQAVQAAQVQEPWIEIRTRQDGDRITIEVEDNGVGILEENLTKVFNHGFTTKPDGHGFGLHGSANAASEMGAELTASSSGPGGGACFSLELPVRVTQEACDD